MKIIPLKRYLKKKKIKSKPLCPKCKIELGFDMNIVKKSMYGIPFRKDHHDAIFECEGCRAYYLVEDYAEEKDE